MVHTEGLDEDVLKAFQRGAFNHVERSMEVYMKVK